MKPKNYSSEAVVLSRKNYGESDRIISVFSKNYGKLNFLAKGVRRSLSRKRGHIEVFSRVKFLGLKGRALNIVTEVELMDSFSSLRKDLRRVSVAYFLVDVVKKITSEEEKHAELYDLLVKTLEELKYQTNLKTLRRNFAFRVLTVLGYWPKERLLENPDILLRDVLERDLGSIRVGKALLS